MNTTVEKQEHITFNLFAHLNPDIYEAAYPGTADYDDITNIDYSSLWKQMHQYSISHGCTAQISFNGLGGVLYCKELADPGKPGWDIRLTDINTNTSIQSQCPSHLHPIKQSTGGLSAILQMQNESELAQGGHGIIWMAPVEQWDSPHRLYQGMLDFQPIMTPAATAEGYCAQDHSLGFFFWAYEETQNRAPTHQDWDI